MCELFSVHLNRLKIRRSPADALLMIIIKKKNNMSEEGASFTFHGISGTNNLFAFPHCQTDRFWRQTLHMTTERYHRAETMNWDECRNAYMKPKAPASINLLESLHKYSDY